MEAIACSWCLALSTAAAPAAGGAGQLALRLKKKKISWSGA